MAVLFAIRPVHCVIRCRLTTYLVKTPHGGRYVASVSIAYVCASSRAPTHLPGASFFETVMCFRTGVNQAISRVSSISIIFSCCKLGFSKTAGRWTIHVGRSATSFFCARQRAGYKAVTHRRLAIVMFYFGDGGGGGLAVIGGGGGARGVLMKRRSQKPWKP